MTLIAMTAQVLVFILGWMKEHRVSIKKRGLDAQYLGIQVAVALDKLVKDCLEAVNDPMQTDADEYNRSTVSNPEFALPAEGEDRTLPTSIDVQRTGSQHARQAQALLRGRSFSSFDSFRRAFWVAGSRDPKLSEQFSEKDLVRMMGGGAPRALEIDMVGKRQSHDIHHVEQISEGGEVYSVDNLRVDTPKNHIDVHKN